MLSIETIAGSVFPNGPGSVFNSFGADYKGPSSVVNNMGIPPSVTNYADLAVPMTPLQMDSVREQQQHTPQHPQHQPSSQLPPSNIPAVVPATPYSAPAEVPSPTLQNIVSTVNLGNETVNGLHKIQTICRSSIGLEANCFACAQC